MNHEPVTMNHRGFTLIELLVTVAVLAILASVAMPLAEMSVRRGREIELRRALREIRQGIDRFKLEYDKAKGNAKDAREVFKERLATDRSGYPLTLQEMVETKVMRRIPKDPMTGGTGWATRSYSDSLDSTLSDNRDVFDVHSASTSRAIDGTTYDTW